MTGPVPANPERKTMTGTADTRSPTTVAIVVQDHDDPEPRTIHVFAEPTDTPGLVITPEIVGGPGGDGFSGGWTVTSTSTGMRVPAAGRCSMDLGGARLFAVELGKLTVDWTADEATIVEQVEAQRDAFLAAAQRSHRGDETPPDGNLLLLYSGLANGTEGARDEQTG